MELFSNIIIGVACFVFGYSIHALATISSETKLHDVYMEGYIAGREDKENEQRFVQEDDE